MNTRSLRVLVALATIASSGAAGWWSSATFGQAGGSCAAMAAAVAVGAWAVRQRRREHLAIATRLLHLAGEAPAAGAESPADVVDAANDRLAARLRERHGRLEAAATTIVRAAEALRRGAQWVADSSKTSQQQTSATVAAADQLKFGTGAVSSGTTQLGEELRAVLGALGAAQPGFAVTDQQAVRVADACAGVAQRSGAAGEILDQVRHAAAAIASVAGSIEDVADQTNLLALNATIEAARAGEAGRGFSVVAEQVKELARQTAGSTQDIRSRLEHIEATSQRAVEAIGTLQQDAARLGVEARSLVGHAGRQRQVIDDAIGRSSRMEGELRDLVIAAERVSSAGEAMQRSMGTTDHVARESTQGVLILRADSAELQAAGAALLEAVESARPGARI